MTAKEYFNKMWCFFDNHTEDGEGILLSKTSEQRGIDMLQEYADQETEKLRAELNELKERHKMDVVKAVDDMTNILIANEVIVSQINFKGTIGEKYYKQKFKK